MRHREFISLLAGVSAAGVAGAQQGRRIPHAYVLSPLSAAWGTLTRKRRHKHLLSITGLILLATLSATVPANGDILRIGCLDGSSQSARMTLLAAFKERLSELGYAQSQYVIDGRYADGHDELLPKLAVDLVLDKPDVILTVGPQAAAAAAQATSAIPIIFVGVGDPVGTGLVPNLARPPGNVTGITLLAVELAAKRLDFLRTAIPGAAQIAILWNPRNPVNGRELKEARDTAATLGVSLLLAEIGNEDEFEGAFAAAFRNRADAVFVLSSPITAIKHRLPAICALREYALAGCLLPYGPSYQDHFRRAASLVVKVLNGAKPADLPVEQPTKFELVVNLKTAKALGVTIPPLIIERADEVIE
jgi:putative ABC transport system substrate-binding protein